MKIKTPKFPHIHKFIHIKNPHKYRLFEAFPHPKNVRKNCEKNFVFYFDLNEISQKNHEIKIFGNFVMKERGQKLNLSIFKAFRVLHKYKEKCINVSKPTCDAPFDNV